MANLDMFLPLRPLLGLWARVVRRELGQTQADMVPVSGSIRDVKSIFSRSVAVALADSIASGRRAAQSPADDKMISAEHSFAEGRIVRREFAQQLLPRMARLRQNDIVPPEVLDRAIGMTVTATEDPRAFGLRPVQLQIEDEDVAREAFRDNERLMESANDPAKISAEALSRPLWSEKPPYWWQRWSERPDRWVEPLRELCEPVWGSQELSPDSIRYLVDFGLDGIEKNPDLIEPWKQTVSQLVTTATKRKVSIRDAVSCCKVEP